MIVDENNIGQMVRDLSLRIPAKERDFLGGDVYSKDVQQIYDSSKKYEFSEIPSYKRVRICTLGFQDDKLTGYLQLTILRNANSTTYEQKYINLSEQEPLNYIQGKMLFTDPKYRTKGATKLLFDNMRYILHQFDLPLVADVKQENSKIQTVMKGFGMAPEFEWFTPKGEAMFRYRQM